MVLIYFEVEASINKIVLSEEHDDFIWVKKTDEIPQNVAKNLSKKIERILG